jgi:hypothetical protein
MFELQVSKPHVKSVLNTIYNISELMVQPLLGKLLCPFIRLQRCCHLAEVGLVWPSLGADRRRPWGTPV